MMLHRGTFQPRAPCTVARVLGSRAALRCTIRARASEPQANAAADNAKAEPRVVEWNRVREELQANADSPYLLLEDDEDDEDEDIIAYKNYLRGGWAAEDMEAASEMAETPEHSTADTEITTWGTADGQSTLQSPVPGTSSDSGPPPLVSAYSSAGGFEEVGPQDLHQLLEELGDHYAPRMVLLLDIRPEPDYTASRVPGAYNVPFSSLSDTVRAGTLFGWKAKTVVVLGYDCGPGQCAA